GALDTVRMVDELRARHAPLCTSADVDMLEQLYGAIRQYADAIGSLLITQRQFDVDANGELHIEPEARGALEARRLKVKDIVARIHDLPVAAPKTPEATRYFGAETA